MKTHSSYGREGYFYAAGAYAIWGLFPVYWKLLLHVPAQQLLCHRILWSFLLLFAVVLASGQWGSFRMGVLKWTALPAYMAAAVLISINWYIYVWAVNAGLVVETSLGYFINPLLSVLLGVIFFVNVSVCRNGFPSGSQVLESFT